MEIKEFFKNDRYAVFSGIELLEVRTGYAKAKMEIKEMHLNGGDVVQGGAIFTLADLAFAAAVNSYGNLALGIQAGINYFKGVSSGTLYAEAKVVNIHKKLGTFQVNVTNENNDLIAEFNATAYRKDITLPFSSNCE